MTSRSRSDAESFCILRRVMSDVKGPLEAGSTGAPDCGAPADPLS